MNNPLSRLREREKKSVRPCDDPVPQSALTDPRCRDTLAER
jgi:hypothetical protein